MTTATLRESIDIHSQCPPVLDCGHVPSQMMRQENDPAFFQAVKPEGHSQPSDASHSSDTRQ